MKKGRQEVGLLQMKVQGTQWS